MPSSRSWASSACLLAALAAPPARAQTPQAPVPPVAPEAAAPAALPALTLEAALARAQAANLDLAAARREVDAAAALRLQAGRLPNPSVAYDSEQVRGGARADGATLSVPLEVGGQRAARVQLAERGQALADTLVAQRAAELRAATRQAFFEALTAQARVQLAEDSLAVAQRAVDVAARRVQAGRAAPVDETRARVAEAAVRVEASQASTELAAARLRLAALLGEPEPRFGPLAGGLETLPPLPEPAALEARVDAAPELARARAEIEQRDAATRLARTQRIPTLVVNAGSRTLAETGQRATSVGVALAVPLFDRNQGNVREAQVRAEQARVQRAAAELRLRAELAAVRERLAGAGREARLVRTEALPGAEGALATATRGFELGKFGFLDVLDAQRALFAARAQLVRAVAEAWRAAADLERLLGPAALADTP